MEILKFDELNKVQSSALVAQAGVVSNVTTSQKLKRKLIADVLCSSIKGTDTGCCKKSKPTAK
ncbi:MAG: hypothetical protein EHM93_10345 [Bacteroidales bacterium]|nr:MAG: hypothetical protein EHM93_10345 [Bacteroidales bacterium]